MATVTSPWRPSTTPRPADVTITTDEDTTGSTAPNCNDVDGDTLTYSIVAQPQRSAAVVAGQLEYSPNLNFNGSDSFSYRANDGTIDSNNATVNVTVNAVNDPPTCQDVSITTDEDTTGSTAPNCNDVDGDTLTYSIVAQPANGSAAVVAGQLEYSPNLNFNGSDSFSYRANDGTIDSNNATVNVTVNAVNDAPIAVDDTASTNEDTLVDTDVVTNDTDVDNVNGDLTVVAASIVATNGTAASWPTTGPSGSPPTSTRTAPTRVPFTVTYKVTDGDLTSTLSATLTITVAAVNDAPIAVNDTASTNEDTLVDMDVVTNDTDVDNVNGDLTVVAASIVATDGTATSWPTTGPSGSPPTSTRTAPTRVPSP